MPTSGSGPGARRDPYLSFNFVLEITGLVVGGFREIKGLDSNVEVKEYAEGGRNSYIHKIPGEARFPNLILSRGITDIDAMWSWYFDVAQGIIVRRNARIILLDTDRRQAISWEVTGALPVKWSGPTFDATRSTEVAVEMVELVHRGISKPTRG